MHLAGAPSSAESGTQASQSWQNGDLPQSVQLSPSLPGSVHMVWTLSAVW